MIALPYRGKGIGQDVLQSIENEIKKNRQVKSILSAVQVNNEAVIKFWQRIGFSIISGPELQPDQTTVYYIHKELNKS